jgi:PIN domain nuclease of toxin-antitoxin system
MTDAAVLDASALLAFLRREPGRDRVEAVLDRAQISAVNLAEVVAKAVDRGGTLEAISDALAPLHLRVIPFAPEDALISGSLHAATRSRGLSLGDRCCLALGVKAGLPVLTTEGIWRDLDVGVTVEVIR